LKSKAAVVSSKCKFSICTIIIMDLLDPLAIWRNSLMNIDQRLP
jgi:hypothetical protein